LLSGVEFHLNATTDKPYEGRVEMAIGGVWGTICRTYFDDADAKVFCKQMGYNDGYVIK
jgi:deleted-in-malignant-brain-tumors protein 1